MYAYIYMYIYVYVQISKYAKMLWYSVVYSVAVSGGYGLWQMSICSRLATSVHHTLVQREVTTWRDASRRQQENRNVVASLISHRIHVWHIC